MKSVAPPSDCDGDREGVLEEFGRAVAAIPWDGDRIRNAMENVKRMGGMELGVEAAAVCGAFEAITKVVDATRRRSVSEKDQRMFRTIMTLSKHRKAIFWVGASTVVGIAAIVFGTRKK